MTQYLTIPVSPSDHIIGPQNAPVTLVEYGDFECPNCAAAYPVIRNLVNSVGDRLRFAFRHFPITLRHDHAEKAAEAVEAAGAQGKFWRCTTSCSSTRTTSTANRWSPTRRR